MKALRVIAGLHAGAWLSLPPGRYCIASGDQHVPEADTPLRLYDWTSPPLFLVVDAHEAISGRHASDPLTPGGSDDGEFWSEFQPRRYGEVVLCTGDAERPWPSDTDLLEMLRVPAAAAGRQRLTWMRSLGARALVVGAGLLVAVGALYGRSAGNSSELPPPSSAVGAQWLSERLQVRGLLELEVRQDRKDVILSGLVRNAEQGQWVRRAVAEVQRGLNIPVVESWEVADEIASTIESALRAPGIQVRYLGTGHFEVVGAVANPGQLRHAAPQLQKDLGANVRGIEFSIERTQSAPTFSVAIAADALQYSERPDGAKVFAARAP